MHLKDILSPVIIIQICNLFFSINTTTKGKYHAAQNFFPRRINTTSMQGIHSREFNIFMEFNRRYILYFSYYNHYFLLSMSTHNFFFWGQIIYSMYNHAHTHNIDIRK